MPFCRYIHMNDAQRFTGRPLSRNIVSRGTQFAAPRSFGSFITSTPTARNLARHGAFRAIAPTRGPRRIPAPSARGLSPYKAPTAQDQVCLRATARGADSAEPSPGSASPPDYVASTRCTRRIPARSPTGKPGQSRSPAFPGKYQTRRCSRQTRSRLAPSEPSPGRCLPNATAQVYALAPTKGVFGTGTPSAVRIMSRVQPAQQIYFYGSSTEIARLSLLVSRPATAQEGHRAIQFRPTFLRTSTWSRIRNWARALGQCHSRFCSGTTLGDAADSETLPISDRK